MPTETGPEVESCSPKAPTSRAPERVGRLRASGRGSGHRASQKHPTPSEAQKRLSLLFAPEELADLVHEAAHTPESTLFRWASRQRPPSKRRRRTRGEIRRHRSSLSRGAAYGA